MAVSTWREAVLVYMQDIILAFASSRVSKLRTAEGFLLFMEMF